MAIQPAQLLPIIQLNFDPTKGFIRELQDWKGWSLLADAEKACLRNVRVSTVSTKKTKKKLLIAIFHDFPVLHLDMGFVASPQRRTKPLQAQDCQETSGLSQDDPCDGEYDVANVLCQPWVQPKVLELGHKISAPGGQWYAFRRLNENKEEMRRKKIHQHDQYASWTASRSFWHSSWICKTSGVKPVQWPNWHTKF